MKTVISVPDSLFAQATALATRLEVSHCQLYAMALEKFVSEHQDNDLTARMNAYIDAYGQPVDPLFLGSVHCDMGQVAW